MDFEALIGLEVHVELNTKTKAFCGCSTKFGQKPNSAVCPVCLALPGALPKLNKKVLEYAIKAGLALNCSISQKSRMDRKNYFYADCPKNYQITQDKYPICNNGSLNIQFENGVEKTIGIERIHMEEDAGKLIHTEEGTLVDFNRAGIPLIEIVSKTDMTNAEEAVLYVKKLKDILTALKISDCKMEEGSLRVDANISVRPKGADYLGEKVEIKNLNSFKNLEKALNYEFKLQVALLKNKNKIFQETKRWDENKEITLSMRDKEGKSDYRYFPEGDLKPFYISKELINNIKKHMPELPDKKRKRFINEYNLSLEESIIITSSYNIANFYEETAKICNDYKSIYNWLTGDIAAYLNSEKIEFEKIKLTPKNFAELILKINNNEISNNIARKILFYMIKSEKDINIIIEENSLKENNDEKEILKIIKEVLENNKENIEKYKNGKDNLFKFFIGEVMKKSKGKANPKIVNELMIKELKEK